MHGLRAVFIACILSMGCGPSAAQFGTIGGAVAIDQLAGSLSAELQEIVRQLANTASRLMMEGRTHVIVTAENIEFLGEKLSGKVFDDLNDAQKHAFQSAAQLVDDFHAKGLEVIAETKDLAASFESAIATLPFSKTFPRVLDYSPAYFVAADNGGTVTIGIEGSWLGYDEPTLAFGDTSCRLASKIETALQFECPSAAIAATPVKMASGALTVFEERNLWEQLLGIFSPNKKPVPYLIGITGLPSNIGTYAATAHVEEPGTERRTREVRFRHDNDHCWDPQQITWPVNADAGNGWQIDVSSPPAPTVISVSSESVFQGVADLSASGFSLRGIDRNNGTCGPKIPFSNDRSWYDGRGHLEVSVSFVEFRNAPVVNPHEIAKGDFAWRRDVPVQLPPNTKAFTVLVDTVEPRSVTATAPGDFGWFNLDYDPDSRVLVLRPKDPDTALAK